MNTLGWKQINMSKVASKYYGVSYILWHLIHAMAFHTYYGVSTSHTNHQLQVPFGSTKERYRGIGSFWKKAQSWNQRELQLRINYDLSLNFFDWKYYETWSVLNVMTERSGFKTSLKQNTMNPIPFRKCTLQVPLGESEYIETRAIYVNYQFI